MRAEPTEVMAMAASPAPSRLPKIEQTVTAILKFPHDRVATFICSFASAGVSNFRVIGDKGDLFIENVYEYVGKAKNTLTINEKKQTWTTKAGDQFAAELDYFSSCVQTGKHPETSAQEGLADLVIIEALLQSLKTGKTVKVKSIKKTPAKRPTIRQVIKKPAHRKPQLINAAPESH